MRREIKRIVSIMTITAALGLSVAAQPEPVCSKYYAVGSRTCPAPPAGNITSADGGGGTLGSGSVVGNGQLGSGNAVDNGQLGSGGVTADGGGGLGNGSFWDWVTSIF